MANEPGNSWRGYGNASWTLFDEVGDFFAHCNDGDVEVGANGVGHDGGVHDAEAIDAVDLAVLVADGEGVAGGAHLAGAGDVVGCHNLGLHPLVEKSVRLQDFVRRGGTSFDDITECTVFEKLIAESKAIAHSLQVKGVV